MLNNITILDGHTLKVGDTIYVDARLVDAIREVQHAARTCSILVAWAHGDITEGIATKSLGMDDRIEARTLLMGAQNAGIEIAAQWRAAHPVELP